MRRLDTRNVLAVLFVIAGAVPIVVWLGSWLYHSATREQILQGGLVVMVLYFIWWLRKRHEKKLSAEAPRPRTPNTSG
jgi:Flp pilus assembly protein TadB